MNEQKYSGCLDGLRGIEIEMTLEQARSCSHQGECFPDCQALIKDPGIAAQLDRIGADGIRTALKESGGWGQDDLADDEANRVRAVWFAACDIAEVQED